MEKEYNDLQQEILVSYKPFPENTEFDISYNKIAKQHHEELQALYIWWKSVDRAEKEFIPGFQTECDEMLDRLMKIRKSLWT